MKRKSFRLRFMFWLDLANPEQAELAEAIEDLKAKRSFARAIRQGLQLWLSLMKGDVGVLLDLFPWIEDHFTRKQGDNGNHDEDFAAAVAAAVAAQLARSGYGGILQQAPLASRPADDDLVLHSVERDTSHIIPGENLLKSLRSIGYEPPPAKPKGPKIMATPTFEAPSFDDLEL